MSAPSSDHAAIRQVIRALRADDHTITGVDIGEGLETFAPDALESAILAEATAGDESTVYVTLPDGRKSHVYFVLGNDPSEVACDWGVSLSPILDPLTESWWD